MNNEDQNVYSPTDQVDENDVKTKIIDLFAPTLANFLDVLMEAAENDDWNYGYGIMHTTLKSASELDGNYVWEMICPDCNSVISTKVNVSRPLFIAAVVYVMKAIMAYPGQDIVLDVKNLNSNLSFDFDYNNFSCDQCGYSKSTHD